MMTLLAQLKASTMPYNRSITPTNNNSEINIEYSPAIKEKLVEEKKFCKLWQINRYPVFKNELNRAIKAFKYLLVMKRHQEIQEYLSKLSAIPETNYSLWKATKRLKRT